MGIRDPLAGAKCQHLEPGGGGSETEEADRVEGQVVGSVLCACDRKDGGGGGGVVMCQGVNGRGGALNSSTAHNRRKNLCKRCEEQ